MGLGKGLGRFKSDRLKMVGSMMSVVKQLQLFIYLGMVNNGSSTGLFAGLDLVPNFENVRLQLYFYDVEPVGLI